MTQPVLGEILMVSFGFAPKGYALCDGQLLNITEYQPLFDLIGTSYGGDGQTQFALPDLRGRVPVASSDAVALGAKGGEESHVLSNLEMPKHTHYSYASADLANEPQPTGNLIAAVAADGDNAFAAASTVANQALGSASVGSTGGGEAHANMQPSFVINFCIALEGTPPASQPAAGE